MSYRLPDFVSEVSLCKATHVWKTPADLTAEVNAIVAALASDATTRDQTMDTRTSAVLTLGETNGILLAGAGYKSRFTNDMILLINAAKGGNLTNSQLISGIDDNFAIAHAPAVIDVPYLYGVPPYANGSVVTCTSGNWTGSPTGYTYQFRRDGTNFGSATSTATYTIVSANDSGHRIDCVVVATNATGSQTAPASNPILAP